MLTGIFQKWDTEKSSFYPLGGSFVWEIPMKSMFFFQKMGWFHVVPEISDCVLGGLGVFPAIDRFQLALGNIMRQQMDRAAMV